VGSFGVRQKGHCPRKTQVEKAEQLRQNNKKKINRIQIKKSSSEKGGGRGA